MKGLDTLATSGAWHATIKLADRLVGSAQPHHRLLIRLYKMVALLKVRQFRVAVEEMASMGDAEAEEYQFERHAELYPDRTGAPRHTCTRRPRCPRAPGWDRWQQPHARVLAVAAVLQPSDWTGGHPRSRPSTPGARPLPQPASRRASARSSR